MICWKQTSGEQGHAIDHHRRGVPTLPIIRATAITLTLCWSTFGWSATLPADLKWESNNQDPLYADPAAKRGGTFRTFMTSFP